MKLLNWKNLFLFSLAILPFSFALNPTSNIDMPFIRALFPLVFLFWFFCSLFEKKIILDKRPRFLILLIFLFICSISFFWANDKSAALTKILFLLSFLPVYFLSYAITKQKKMRLTVLKVFVFSSFVAAFFALFIFSLQFIFGIDTAILFATKTTPFFLGKNFSGMVLAYPSWLVNINGKTIMRTFGSFPDPHLFSLFINLSLPFSFYLWKKTSLKIYLFLGSVCLIASLLSFSRASYLAIFLGLFFSILLFSNFHNNLFFIKKHFSKFLGIAFFIFLFLLIPNPLTQRFASSFNLNEGSNSGRLDMWRLAISNTLEKPLTGVGIGNFAKYNFPMSTSNDPIYAHNLFLDFSSEIGFIGALFLIILFLSPFIALNKKASSLNKTIALAIFIFAIHSLFETPFYSIRVFPLFFLILAIDDNA